MQCGGALFRSEENVTELSRYVKNPEMLRVEGTLSGRHVRQLSPGRLVAREGI